MLKESKETDKKTAKSRIKLQVSTAKISNGCYKIKCSGGSVGSKIALCLGTNRAVIDISKGYSYSNLPSLLKVIDQNKLWSKTVNAYAINYESTKETPGTRSLPVKMALPVEPYKGVLSLEAIGKDRNLSYTGIQTGRMLHTKKINGWHLIKFGGFAETSNKFRGLNCITYVGAAFGKENGMNGYGTKLANALGAKKCEMECKFKSELIDFFNSKGKSGAYIMWDQGHVVVVKNGMVYEFTNRKGINGFSRTPVKTWGFSKRPYWVRKL